MPRIFLIIIVFICCFNESLSGNKEYIIKADPGKSTYLQSAGIEGLKPAFGEMITNLKSKNDHLLSNNSRNLLKELSGYYIYSSEKAPVQTELDELRAVLGEFSIEPNYIFKTEQAQYDDPDLDELWNLRQVNALQAHTQATGKGVIIGMIDTGIDYEHPDLVNNLYINEAEDINNSGRFEPWPSDMEINGITGDLNGIDEDGNGYPDDVIGYDFVDQSYANVGDYNNPDPDVRDEGEHGTKVAGVLAATGNNTTGIVGAAPGAKILTLRAFDINGQGESDDIAACIIYAVMNGARVLNMSFGEEYESSIVHDAIRFAASMGVFMAASAGNDGGFYGHYPSDYDEVLSVGGTNSDGEKFGAGNYGSMLNLAAPGSSVYTTEVGGGYVTISGTSFSAPHAAAAACLIIEKYPGISPEEIEGLLMSSARDAGSPGWDIYYGAGILDIQKALNFTGTSLIQIASPENEQLINRSIFPELEIKGSTVTPLFSDYEMSFGYGILPSEWEIIQVPEPAVQKKNSPLAVISFDDIADTVITLQLKINLKNGGSIEKRKYLSIISNENDLKISSIRTLNPYIENRRATAVAAITNQKCDFMIAYRKAGSEDDYTIIKEIDKRSYEHLIIIDGEDEGSYEGYGVAYGLAGKPDTSYFSFDFIDEKAGLSGFIQKDYSLLRSYYYNDTADFYNNGMTDIVINDQSTLADLKTIIMEFDGRGFTARDSVSKPWAVVGLGDSNNDGVPEILGTNFGNTVLFQASEPGGNPFSGKLYESNPQFIEWAAGMHDYTGDGVPEIIVRDNQRYYIMKNQNSSYIKIDSTILPEDYASAGVDIGSAFGDFDGDGNQELFFTNARGNLFIYEYSSQGLKFEKLFPKYYSYASQFVTTLDIDDDGIKEILIADLGGTALFDKTEAIENTWNARIVKSTGANSYKIVWEGSFLGVRSGGIPRLGANYKNGIAAGNVDGQPGDEFILSFMPDLYIFKWDESNNEPKLIYHDGRAFSNSVVVNDFDGNGINEVIYSGFGLYSNVIEFADSTRPHAPTGADGYAINDTSAILKWDLAPGADKYNIYQIITNDEGTFAQLLTDTEADSIRITGLNSNRYYDFIITTIDEDLPNTESDPAYSEVVRIYTANSGRIISAEGGQSPKIVIALFNTLIAESKPREGDFRLRNSENGNINIPQTAQILNDESLALIFESALPEGNYTLYAGTFRDGFNNPTQADSVSFILKSPDEFEEMYLASLEVLSQSEIRLSFSHDIGDGALEPANYELVPAGKIESVSLAGGNDVTLTLNPQFTLGARGFNYSITALNMFSKENIPMTTGPGNTLSFVFAGDDNENAYVYPNPVKRSKAKIAYFANLTDRAEVVILTLTGELVNTLQESDGNGGVEWDLRDRHGNTVDTGIYLFMVKEYENGEVISESGLKKFAVLP
ncbi:MAG: S8 family serine peptidase [Candidatus Kapaibacterium sp.]